MKPKNTLILFLIALVLAVGVKFYDHRNPGTREAALAQYIVLPFAPQDITGIEITNSENKITLTKNGEDWFLAAPAHDRANTAAVASLLTTAQNLTRDSFIKIGSGNPTKSLAKFGLDKPKITLKLLGKNAPPALFLGSDSAIEGKIYASAQGSGSVDIISDDLKKQLNKPADDFRDPRLTHLLAGQITKFNVQSANGELAFTKDRADHWHIEKPLNTRADDNQINDVLASMLNTQITRFIPADGANLDTYGLAEPRGTVTFTAEGDTKPLALQIGAADPKIKNSIFAKIADRDNAILVVPETLAKILSVKPNDFRDRHLIALDFDTVDRIHIAPAGKPPLLLSRSPENAWTLLGEKSDAKPQPANSDLIRRMVADLQNCQIVNFTSDATADFTPYGLDKPQLKITFSSYASNNTAESTAGEEPIFTLDFGKTDGENIYARIEGEPFVAAVNRNILNSIPLTAIELQPLDIFQLQPDAITSLTINSGGKEIALIHAAKNGWQPKSGDEKIDQIHAQSLINTLAKLHAVRWLDLDPKLVGLDSPLTTITFATANHQQLHTLRIGISTSDQMWNAQIDTQPGVFLISNPDHQALAFPLTANSAPSPAAASPTPAIKP